MKKVLLNILLVVWLVIAITITISLLSFNDFRVTEIGKYSFIAVDSDGLEPDYKSGDLLIATKSSYEKINAGDDIFYYIGNRENVVNLDTVVSKERTGNADPSYEMKAGHSVSNEYVIGRCDDVKVIKDLGTIVTILQSRWGFMFIVIFPTVFLFVYEIYNVIVEIRKDNKKKE